MLCQILAENDWRILHNLLKQSPDSKPMKMSWNDYMRKLLHTKVMSSLPKSGDQSQPAITHSCIFLISASGARFVIAKSHEIRAKLVKRCPKRMPNTIKFLWAHFFILKTWAMKMVFSKEERDTIISKCKNKTLRQGDEWYHSSAKLKSALGKSVLQKRRQFNRLLKFNLIWIITINGFVFYIEK